MRLETEPTSIFPVSPGDPISCVEVFDAAVIVGTLVGSVHLLEPGQRTTTLTVVSDLAVRGAYLEQRSPGIYTLYCAIGDIEAKSWQLRMREGQPPQASQETVLKYSRKHTPKICSNSFPMQHKRTCVILCRPYTTGNEHQNSTQTNNGSVHQVRIAAEI